MQGPDHDSLALNLGFREGAEHRSPEGKLKRGMVGVCKSPV